MRLRTVRVFAGCVLLGYVWDTGTDMDRGAGDGGRLSDLPVVLHSEGTAPIKADLGCSMTAEILYVSE